MPRKPIVIERILSAAPEAVFAAWGDSASLRAWMLPAPTMHGASVEADFRVGGHYRIVMHDRERDYVHRGEYLEIAPPSRIVMTWFSEWAPAGQERTLLTVEIAPAGGGRSRLVLTHAELPESPAYDGHQGGWEAILAKLTAHLEGGSLRAPEPATSYFDREPTRLPGESAEYTNRRAELLAAEIALREQVERVAALRRELPRETPLPHDYAFELVDLTQPVAPLPRRVALSELLEPGRSTLILLHFMYGKAQTAPCPMCTLWADGYDGIAPHLRQRASFAVVVAGDVGAFAEYARGRGWRHLRLVSSADSSFKKDLGFEAPDGAQYPGVSVFTRAPGQGVSHFYSQCAIMAPRESRGMDLLSPLWNFLDLTPEGRGDFMPKRQYEP